VVEARSVNHRFLEVGIKGPRTLTGHEPELRRMAQGRLARGRLDVSVVTRWIAGGPGVLRTDTGLAAQYVREARALARSLGVAGELSLADVLRLPGVVSVEEAMDDDGEGGVLLKEAFHLALDELVRMRQAEGALAASDLDGHVRALEAWTVELQTILPDALARVRERVRARIEALLGEAPIDPARVAQEAVTWAVKSDVAEEVARLLAHVSQFRALLEGGGAVGRQLDFVTQEMHREVNTIAAKADDEAVVARVLAGRMVVERLREQVQNVE
jgi:uncharacterized protein (TIGR00255 family)